MDADGDTRQVDFNAAFEPPFQEPPPHGLESCDLDVLNRGIQVGHGSLQVGAVEAVAEDDRLLRGATDALRLSGKGGLAPRVAC